ncbi:MAG: type II toxin-antitoxin system VapC family toxin [Spirochaetota bacterium]
MYLLDTNICIYAINKKPELILNRIKKEIHKGIFISALTIAELEYGVENSSRIEENRVALLKFLSIFNILAFDDLDPIAYGKLKSKLKRTGNIIGPIDMLLAAQAISRGLILVTNNTKEFSRIEGLKIEDWTLPL